MKSLKVCFSGVGSIAKRHIRNLAAVCAEKKISLQMDAYRRSGERQKGIDHIYTAFEEVPDDYDAVFITNFEPLNRFHSRARHFFIEKPVVSLNQLETASEFQTRPDSVYYVAAPLRYNAVIQWIKNNVDPAAVISVRSISSSYLPDWRPGQDYRETYSARKDMGGGVSIHLIHEWDYLTYLFGWPEKVCCLTGKKSALEIDSDDYALYIAEYSDKIAELHLDYFGRKTIREIQLIAEDETIVGNIVSNTIQFLVKNEEIDFCEKRDDFQKRELNHFLEMIAGAAPAEDGYHHGLDLLRLTQGEA